MPSNPTTEDAKLEEILAAMDMAKRKHIEELWAVAQMTVDEILKKKQQKESLPKESVREMAKEAVQLVVEIAKKKQQKESVSEVATTDMVCTASIPPVCVPAAAASSQVPAIAKATTDTPATAASSQVPAIAMQEESVREMATQMQDQAKEKLRAVGEHVDEYNQWDVVQTLQRPVVTAVKVDGATLGSTYNRTDMYLWAKVRVLAYKGVVVPPGTTEAFPITQIVTPDKYVFVKIEKRGPVPAGNQRHMVISPPKVVAVQASKTIADELTYF